MLSSRAGARAGAAASAGAAARAGEFDAFAQHQCEVFADVEEVGAERATHQWRQRRIALTAIKIVVASVQEVKVGVERRDDAARGFAAIASVEATLGHVQLVVAMAVAYLQGVSAVEDEGAR